MKCKNCGKKIVESNFCPYCGESQIKTNNKCHKRYVKNVVILVVIVFAVCMFVSCFWYSRRLTKEHLAYARNQTANMNIDQFIREYCRQSGHVTIEVCENDQISIQEAEMVSCVDNADPLKYLVTFNWLDSNDTTSYEVTYNSDGVLTSVVYKDFEDMKIRYSFTQDGLLAKYIDDVLGTYYEHIYNDEGMVISVRDTTGTDDEKGGITDLLYDDKGYITQINSYDVNNDLVLREQIFYDDNNEICKTVKKYDYITLCIVYTWERQ